MSTIKVNKIENTSTTDGGVSIDNDGHVTIDGQQLPTAGPLSNRNLIINGAMQVAQRGVSKTSVTTAGYYAVDRYNSTLGTLGTWTVSQENDAPDGFNYSLKHTCTSADPTPNTNDYAVIFHKIETQNIIPQIAYGSSSAQYLTLSFWVKSNKTGNATCGLFHTTQPGDRYSSKVYTINSSDTWERKIVTFEPDSVASSSALADNAWGFNVEWWLNSGSRYTQGSSSSWTTAEDFRNQSNIGIGGAVNDYLQITGVQLEVGSKATPFEHRSYGDELARCQRYYTKFTATAAGERIGVGYVDSSTGASCLLHFPVEMRSNPTTMDQSGTANDYSAASTSIAICNAVPVLSIATKNSATVVLAAASMPGAVRTSIMARYNSTNAFFGFSAEL